MHVMFPSSRCEVPPLPAGIEPAPYALPRGVPALAADPVRQRRWLAGGGVLLALAAGWVGFACGRLGRTPAHAVDAARALADLDDDDALRQQAARVLAVAPRVPDDAAIAVALDRLARLALQDRGPSGAELAERLLSAFRAGAVALRPRAEALARRVRGG